MWLCGSVSLSVLSALTRLGVGLMSARTIVGGLYWIFYLFGAILVLVWGFYIYTIEPSLLNALSFVFIVLLGLAVAILHEKLDHIYQELNKRW